MIISRVHFYMLHLGIARWLPIKFTEINTCSFNYLFPNKLRRSLSHTRGSVEINNSTLRLYNFGSGKEFSSVNHTDELFVLNSDSV